MVTFLKELVAGYEDTNDKIAKMVIYNEVCKYLKESHPWAVTYDMEAYVMLYKYATTSYQRAHALSKIGGIIIDDFIGGDGIVSNFKEFIVMKDFLYDECDEETFDSLCMSVLMYFDERIKKSLKSDENYVEVLKKYLREVARSIKSTEMMDMRSYKFACKVLE